MRILVAQINPTFGDFSSNSKAILTALNKAKKENCSLMITPELSLVGYPPNDFLFLDSLFDQHQKALEEIIKHTEGITLILGALSSNPNPGNRLFNSALHIENKKLIGAYHKSLLPTYDVFDERRYFEPGSSPYVFTHQNQTIALSICEDIWFESMSPKYSKDPLESLEKKTPDLLLNLSASPYEKNKPQVREKLAQKVCKRLSCQLLYCNQVGGNDDLIFDGQSFLCDQKNILIQAPCFKEASMLFETKGSFCVVSEKETPKKLFDALVLGIRDYFQKLKFQKCVLGLSGGIDSALVACLAKEALGAHQVTALLLPSKYSSPASLLDAQKLVKNLGIHAHTLDIEPLHQTALGSLSPLFEGLKMDLTEENIQARIRGLLLMAYSNKFNALTLCCSNKSELAVGFSTLYGDLIGAIAPIGDLSKTEVYHLARWIQTKFKWIPHSILDKPPSAELRPNQKDSDTLPEYNDLDALLAAHIEKKDSPEQISKKLDQPLEEAQKLIGAIYKAEYKRRQAPLVLKTSLKAFSSGWNFPIVHGFSS